LSTEAAQPDPTTPPVEGFDPRVDEPTGTPVDNAADPLDAISTGNDLEAAVLAAFEAREADGPTPTPVPPRVDDAPPSPPADTSTPDAATPTAVEPEHSPPVVEAAAPPAAPDPSAPVGQPGVVVVDGAEVPADQVADLWRWANSLSPEQAQAVADVLSGQAQIVPAGQAPQAQPTTASTPPAASGYGTPTPTGPTPVGVGDGVDQPQFDPRELDDMVPGLGSYLTTLQAQQAQQAALIAQTQSQAAQLAAYQAQVQAQETDAQLAAGVDAFRASHADLTEADVDNLMSSAARLQILPGLAQQHGSIQGGVVAALETALWADPNYRTRAIQSQVESFAQTSATVSQRKAKAAALSGGTPTPDRNPAAPDPRTMTDDQRRQAMAAEIANVLEGNIN
jgi:hypothetical protein